MPPCRPPFRLFAVCNAILNSAGVKLGNVLATAAIRWVMHEATLEVSAMVRSPQIAALRGGAGAEETSGHDAKQGAKQTFAQMLIVSSFAAHRPWHSSREEQEPKTAAERDRRKLKVT